MKASVKIFEWNGKQFIENKEKSKYTNDILDNLALALQPKFPRMNREK